MERRNDEGSAHTPSHLIDTAGAGQLMACSAKAIRQRVRRGHVPKPDRVIARKWYWVRETFIAWLEGQDDRKAGAA